MTAATGRSFPRHTHDQYGIGIVDSGGHSSWSGRGQVEAGPGTFICVNPAELHDGRPVGRRDRSWRMFYFDVGVVTAVVSDLLDGDAGEFTFALPVFQDSRLHDLFNRAFAFTQSAVGVTRDTMACETALIQLIARLMAHSTANKRPDRGTLPSIHRVRSRIDADPAAPATLVELARDVGLSRYQLIRGFARELNLTPHAYILQQRIALARRLIRAGHSLTDVAADAGFFDQSHMTRCFVRQFGVTPLRYQRRPLSPSR